MARKLSRREKIILFLCLVLVFLFSIHHLVLLPIKSAMTGLQEKINQSERRLLKNMSILSRASVIGKEYEKYASGIRQKSSDEKEMASILSEIEAAASKISMRVVDMKPKKVRRVDFHNNFSVSLTVDGELATVIRFLYTLQNSPYFLSTDEIRLEKGSVRNNQVKCYLTLSKTLIASQD